MSAGEFAARLLRELGYETSRSGRAILGQPVVLTSDDSHVLAEKGAHGFDFLQKPYPPRLSRVVPRATTVA